MIFFFFFNDTATTEIYTLSLHDALPIWEDVRDCRFAVDLYFQAWSVRDDLQLEPMARIDVALSAGQHALRVQQAVDRKSTRLNSSHANISYAVFCLKKKKKYINHILTLT